MKYLRPYIPYILGFLAILIFLPWIKKQLGMDADSQAKKDLEDAIEDEKKKIDLSKSRYTQGEYETMCHTLMTAFTNLGTDEDSVHAVFTKMSNNTETQLLYSAWGVRSIPYGIFFSAGPFTLAEAITDEMGTLGGRAYDLAKQKLEAAGYTVG